MKNYINCPDGWTNVRITIPKRAYISLFQGSAPFSWYFKTSGNMEKWSVYDLSSGYQKRMLNGADYINGFNATGDTVDFDIFNNGYPQSSFWLYMPNMAELDSAGVASFESSLNSNNISNNLDSSKNDILNNNNSNTNNILNNNNQNKNDILNNNNQNKNDIINNQNSNSQNEIDNANKNKQELIDNANKNSQDMIDNNNQLIKGNCKMKPGKNLFNYIDNLNSSVKGLTSTINSDGSITTTGIPTVNYVQIFNLIDITDLLENNQKYTVWQENKDAGINLRPVISLRDVNTNNIVGYITLEGYISRGFTVDKTKYRYFINVQTDTTANWGTSSRTITNKYMLVKGNDTTFEKYEEKEVCEGGLNNSVDNVKDSVDNLNDSINNSNIDSSSANSFFSNFKDNDYGLSSVVTAPLQFIKNLNNNVCTPLKLEIPFIENSTLELPCMTTIYKKNFNSFLTIYQTITTGFIAYWVSVRIFALVKGFKDPENDKLEVMDL